MSNLNKIRQSVKGNKSLLTWCMVLESNDVLFRGLIRRGR